MSVLRVLNEHPELNVDHQDEVHVERSYTRIGHSNTASETRGRKRRSGLDDCDASVFAPLFLLCLPLLFSSHVYLWNILSCVHSLGKNVHQARQSEHALLLLVQMCLRLSVCMLAGLFLRSAIVYTCVCVCAALGRGG